MTRFLDAGRLLLAELLEKVHSRCGPEPLSGEGDEPLENLAGFGFSTEFEERQPPVITLLGPTRTEAGRFLEPFRSVCRQRGLPEQFVNTIVVADVCRPDWLCEMELTAALPRPRICFWARRIFSIRSFHRTKFSGRKSTQPLRAYRSTSLAVSGTEFVSARSGMRMKGPRNRCNASGARIGMPTEMIVWRKSS